MHHRLNALRAERASAACALQALVNSEFGQSVDAPGRQDRMGKLMRTIERLDDAIAQWNDSELRFA